MSNVLVEIAGGLSLLPIRLIVALIPHHCPDHACRFIGLCHGGDVAMSAFPECHQPPAAGIVFSGSGSLYATRPVHQQTA